MAKQVDMHVDNVPHIIVACCILPNMCEIHHDSFNEEWLEGLNNLDQPEQRTSTESSAGLGGDQIRAILMDYFSVIMIILLALADTVLLQHYAIMHA